MSAVTDEVANGARLEPRTIGALLEHGSATLAQARDSEQAYGSPSVSTAARSSTLAEPRFDAEVLLGHAAQIARSTVLAHPERSLPAEVVDRYRSLVARRAGGEPIAYLVGRREFHAVTLEVTPAVLVPRPETELLVDALLELIAPGARVRVLDLGTGSGALALAIKQARPELSVFGADISEAALDVARANGERLGLEVEWRLSDWFAALGAERFDAIVCNPPYVASDDPHFDGALRHEPRCALDGGADGLDACRTVLIGARSHLPVASWLLLEHGFDQQDAVVDLALEAGYRVAERLRDLGGLARALVLQAP